MDNNKALGITTNMRRRQMQIRGLSFVPVNPLHRFYRINPLESTLLLSKDGTRLDVHVGHILSFDIPSDCLFIHMH